MTSNGSARGRHDTSSTQPAKLTWSEESPTQYKCWANSRHRGDVLWCSLGVKLVMTNKTIIISSSVYDPTISFCSP